MFPAVETVYVLFVSAESATTSTLHATMTPLFAVTVPVGSATVKSPNANELPSCMSSALELVVFIPTGATVMWILADALVSEPEKVIEPVRDKRAFMSNRPDSGMVKDL